MANADQLQRYRQDLAEPRKDFVTRKFTLFGVKPSVLEELPSIIVCGVRKVSIRPTTKEYSRHVFALKPKSLDDLKEWVGLPNRILDNDTRCRWLPEVCLHHLPAKSTFDFEALDQEQRVAVHKMAQNLLYGKVDIERAKRPPLRGVVDYMLGRVKIVYLLGAPNLIVCPGEEVEFAGFATLYFNNVVVYGSGTIRPGVNTRLHAYRVRHA